MLPYTNRRRTARRRTARPTCETLEPRRLLAATLTHRFDSDGDFETDPRLIAMFHGPLAPGRGVPRIQGVAAFVDEPEPEGTLRVEVGGDNEEPPAAPPFDIDQTFKLHSRPDSNFTIYLDFDGHTTVGTTWNSVYGFTEIVHPNYWGGTGSDFSNSRLELIQEIWQIVAEDFAPFDVNVTTEEPVDLDDLRYNGGDDARWGSRVVMTKDTFADCGCGGHAFIGAFDDTQDEPALVYNGGLNAGSETVSHEVGHQFGLNHDGVGSTTYSRGHGSGATGWGPIMGAPFGKRTTHWSNGNYFNASNTSQDDLAVITGPRNFPYAPDDHANDRASATPLDESETTSVAAFGIIERNDDVDWFQFSTGGGDVSFEIDVLGYKPNLDVWAGIFDSSGEFVTDSSPQDALSASFSNLSLTPGDYFIKIDGVARDGAYDPSLDRFVEPDPPPYTTESPLGYSDYGSLGQYRISGSIVDPGVPTVSVVAETPVILEGETATFTVTSSDAGDVDVTVAIRPTRQLAPGLPAPNSTEAFDFSGPLVQTVSLVNGNATVQVPTVDDFLIEGQERFELAIIDAGTYGIADRSAATDIDESRTSYAVLSVDSDGVEGDPGSGSSHTFAINRLGRDDSTHVVGWRRIENGTDAADPSDFASPDSGTVTFLPGESSKTLTVEITGDAVVEPDETYAIEIFVPDGETFQVESVRDRAEGIIRDDESIISINSSALFRVRQVSFSQGNFDHWALDNFSISGTPISDDFDPEPEEALWSSIDGGTTSDVFPDSDGNALFFTGANTRTAQTIPVSPSPGSNANLDIVFAGANGGGLNATESGEDAVLEYSLNDGVEWTQIRRFDEAQYTAWTNFAVELPAEATFAPTTFRETDSGSSLQSITVPRLGFVDKPISIEWTITPTGDNPVSADDFVGGLPSGTTVFNSGDRSANVDFTIAGDLADEPDETFLLTITSNSGGPVLRGEIEATIINDDLPVPNLEVLGADQTLIFDGDTTPNLADGTEFALTELGGVTTTNTFEIRNAGGAGLSIERVSITGADSDDFTITVPSASSIAAGESANFGVTFVPTQRGRRTAKVQILSNDADDPVHEFDISGLGTDLRVEALQLNEGDSSRSQLTSVKVIFNQLVEHGPLGQAFEIRNLDLDVVVPVVVGEPADVDGRTEVELTFGSGDSVIDRQGTGWSGNSLADGNYELRVRGGTVLSTVGLDTIRMLSDHWFGSDSEEIVPADRFFRLFGDQDGDRDVDGQDYGRFGRALFTNSSSPFFNGYFDVEGDGDVDGQDYGQFGTQIFARLEV